MDNHDHHMDYIQAIVLTAGLVFFGACLWYAKLEATVCVVAIIALLNQYRRSQTPIDLSGAFHEGRVSALQEHKE